LILAMQSESRDLISLSEEAARVQERLQTTEGVAEIRIWGEKRPAMKMRIDPLKMKSFGLNLTDVRDAIARQNVDYQQEFYKGWASIFHCAQ
jgi:multidrug efflux pump